MKVTLLQTDIVWGQPVQNIQKAEKLLMQQPFSDVYVLPEMWSTGFATKPHGIAHSENRNVALQWMQETAQRHRCAITGSLAVRLSDGSFRNRHYFVNGRNGQISYYDKHHLFSYGHENEFYTAGTEHVIVEYGGFRILLLTCYDLRFPVWSRYSRQLDYDAVIVVANWPQSRQSAWHILTRARAIENQCYLIGVNRVGDDDYSHYAGNSCVIDPIGRTMGQCMLDREQVMTVDVDINELQHRREKFKVLEDRDIF